MKILIVGGYGTFGGRLAQLLAAERALTLVIAGRSQQKAVAFCASLAPGAATLPVRFDRDGDLAAQLRAIAPDLLVDATGPFQFYGGDSHRVIKACLAASIHYMDLADGSDFVKHVAQFDAEAKAKGVYVLSGVSSFPVLTAAAVRHLTGDIAKLATVTGGIAPSPYAGVGLNVIRAIAGYSGQRVTMTRDGKAGHGYPLTESLRYTICPPGYLPLRNLHFSLVDVPDLQVLPELWPELESTWMGAAPVPEILHRMLNGLAWLVRCRLLPTLSPFARLIFHVANIARWGEDRGGMFVAVTGYDAAGRNVQRSWHMVAEGRDGPFIPSMAVEAIVRRSLKGLPPAPGARAATRELELADYADVFRNRAIHSGAWEAGDDSPALPLYRRILGKTWHLLPNPIRAMHSLSGAIEARGHADVERGTGLLARIAAALFGFPAAGSNVPLTVDFKLEQGAEHWRRTFGGKSFVSRQYAGDKRSERLLVERFGPFSFGLALTFDGNRLHLVARKWNCCGIPLPASWAPGGESYEYVQDGRFCFHVEIRQRWIGLIVRYRGWLELASNTFAKAA